MARGFGLKAFAWAFLVVQVILALRGNLILVNHPLDSPQEGISDGLKKDMKRGPEPRGSKKTNAVQVSARPWKRAWLQD